MALPANISTRWVEGQFLTNVTDGSDPDRKPDGIAAQGFVKFVAAVPYLLNVTAEPNPATLLMVPRVAVLDDEGYICTPVRGTLTPAYRGIMLECTDDPDGSVTGWTWNVTYTFMPVGGVTPTVDSDSFPLPASDVALDLTTVVKVPSSNGIGKEQAEVLAASAQAAAVRAAADAAKAMAAAEEALGAAVATDSNVSSLVGTEGTETNAAVARQVESAASSKLDADEAASTYQSIDGLDAVAASKVNAENTSLRQAVDARAQAAASSKLDATEAADTFATKDSLEGVKAGATPSNGARPIGKGEMGASVRDYGAIGDGTTSDAAAISRAHADNDAVYYPPGNYTPGASNNLYNGGYRNAIGPRWQVGRPGVPSMDARPVMWAQKHSSADRSVNPAEWDQGGGYFALIKESGNAYGAGLTGYARHSSGTGGQIIGAHSRAVGAVPEAQVWGGWSYATGSLTETPIHTTIGHEININNRGPAQGWNVGAAVGSSRGLVIVTADGSSAATHALYIGRQEGTGGWYSGIVLRGGAIQPSGPQIPGVVGDGEAVRLEGTPLLADAYNAIRLRSGYFTGGLVMSETSFRNNAAIVLASGHRIVVGSPTSSRYLAFDTAAGAANLSNLSLQINGTQVLGARRSGWAPVGGLSDKDAWTTYTAPVVTATPTREEVQALANHVQVLSRHLAALQNDLTTHGLIGA